MNKIYGKYDDQYVRGTFVYVKSNDAYAYSDTGLTTKITSAALSELFQKGTIVIVDGTMNYQAVSYGITATVGTLTYVKTDAQTATTAVLATLKSSEFAG